MKHNLRLIYREDGMYLVDNAGLSIPLWEIYKAKRTYEINLEIERLNWKIANLEKGLSEDGKPLSQWEANRIVMKELDDTQRKPSNAQ